MKNCEPPELGRPVFDIDSVPVRNSGVIAVHYIEVQCFLCMHACMYVCMYVCMYLVRWIVSLFQVL